MKSSTPPEVGQGTQRPDWVGQRALAWVIDDAPVPADLMSTLVVIARRCDENGKGSYQSIPTIAAKTGKSDDQVRRDVAALLGLGLLALGDQSLPERNGVPAGKRPVVYDVVLGAIGPKPARKSKNKSGGRKEPGTTRMDATPGMHATPRIHATPTPCMDAGSTPCMDATQTKPLNNPSNNPSLSPREPNSGTSSVRVEDRERDEVASPSKPEPKDPARQALAVADVTDDDEAARLIPVIVAENNVRTPAWWRTVGGNRDIIQIVADARKVLDGTGPCQRCKGHRGRVVGDVRHDRAVRLLPSRRGRAHDGLGPPRGVAGSERPTAPQRPAQGVHGNAEVSSGDGRRRPARWHTPRL